jgi:hypothetical protein
MEKIEGTAIEHMLRGVTLDLAKKLWRPSTGETRFGSASSMRQRVRPPTNTGSFHLERRTFPSMKQVGKPSLEGAFVCGIRDVG